MSNKDSAEVVEFLGLFARLKDWSDDPKHLMELALEDQGVKRLCEQLFWAAASLKMNERRHRQLFTRPVDRKFINAWREYEDEFQQVLATISLTTLGLNFE